MGASSKDAVGSILDGRYRLDEVIGTGSMGTVYRATQLTVQRPVAIKVLNASVKHHPKLQQRFEVEARAVAKLNHPNVLTLFDFAYSMDKDLLYMVVEYIEGDTLSALISRGISTRLSLHIAFQIANALSHAHDAGIAHRDLKPGNVMMAHERRGERVKVLDFGLARVFDGGGKRISDSAETYGAPAYMSPEQCGAGGETGPASDMYALGCIMFEMLEGTLPFDFEGPSQLMQAHMHVPAPKPNNGAVTEEIRELVHRLLSKAPDERPSADDAMDILQRSLDVDVSMETLLREELIHGTDAPTVPALDDDVPAVLSAELARVQADYQSKLTKVIALSVVIIVLLAVAAFAV